MAANCMGNQLDLHQKEWTSADTVAFVKGSKSSTAILVGMQVPNVSMCSLQLLCMHDKSR